jgi:putative cell wall-binding protein
MRFPRKLAGGLTAAALAVSGLALTLGSAPAGATSTVIANAFGGANRYATASNVTNGTFGTSATVILSSGENYPDGLAAAALGGAYPAAMLLSPVAGLAPETINTLGTLKAKNVITVGGTAALSATVTTQLAGFGYTVTNVSGADRYATAAAVATKMAGLVPIGLFGGKKTAFLASGANFPDALSAGPAAYARNIPILLSDPLVLSPASSTAITALGIQQVVILGGTAAISAAVATAVAALPGVTTMRIAGTTRYDTSAQLATFELASPSPGPSFNFLGLQGGGAGTGSVEFVSGLNFPDALSAAQRGGKIGAPIVLDDPLETFETAFLNANASDINNIDVIGGLAVIPQVDINAALLAANPSGGTATIAGTAGANSFTVTFSTTVQSNTVAAGNFSINNTNLAQAAPVTPYTGTTCVQSGATMFRCTFLTAGTVLHQNDLIAMNSSVLTSTGQTVAATSFTVPAVPALAVTASAFTVGATHAYVQFNQPIKQSTFIAANVTLTNGNTFVVSQTDPLAAFGGLPDTVELTLSKAIIAGDTLTLNAGVTNNASPATGISDVITATPDNTQPSVVTDAHNYTFVNTTQAFGSVSLTPLTTGGAAGVAATDYFVKTTATTGAPYSSTITEGPVAANATTGCPALVTAVNFCVVIVSDPAAQNSAQLATSLQSDAHLTGLFTATTSGAITTTAATAFNGNGTQGSANYTTDVEALVYNKPLEGTSVGTGAAGVANYTIDVNGNGTPAAFALQSPCTAIGGFADPVPFDNGAAPTIVTVCFILPAAAPLVSPNSVITATTRPLDYAEHAQTPTSFTGA